MSKTLKTTRGTRRAKTRVGVGRMLLCSVAVLALLWTRVDGQKADAQAGENRNFDARVTAGGAPVAGQLASQLAAVATLKSVYPSLAVSYDEKTGVTRTLMNQAGYLTLPDAGNDAMAIATNYIAANPELLGLIPGDVAGYEVTDVVPNPRTGSTHIYLRQNYQGLSVYNAQLQVNVNREGRILSVNNQFAPSLATSINLVSPVVSAAQAVAAAAAHLKIPLNGVPRTLDTAAGIDRVTSIDNAGLSQQPIKAKLMYLPIQRGVVRLVWNFNIYTLDSQHWYDMTVDAETEKIWTRFDWVASDQYTVYPRPVESPNHTTPLPPADGRVAVTNPANAVASPLGWHDTNGVAGAEFTVTRGNNAYAYTDVDANNVPDPSSSPDGTASLLFNFPIDLTQAPAAYRPAAVTNLFFWNNLVHDIQYQYGFTEAGGNFQTNNYGRGGLGNDEVQAEAQDGSGINNANFATPADGARPRMQMFIWNTTTPNRDGDVDSGVIVHEYGHGISNRLVGGPANVSCLTNTQQPGEGLSDWWTLAYTAKVGDTGPMGRGIGTYVLGQATNGPGIRAQRYSTDPAINTWTYASINGMAVPHGVGSVWAQGAWEMYWALVNQYGFDPNLYNAAGTAGNQRAMLYVNEGLQNTICSPAFTDVRDGIIQAAMDNHGGQDVCLLWNAFAAFGLGANAVSGGPNSTTPTNGFGVPAACLPGGAPALSVNDVTVLEGNPTATFTVTLNQSPSAPVLVNFATADNTAVSTTVDTTTTNATAISIPDSGAATPYPSVINIAATPGPITKVQARLNGFSHTFPSDVDVLLQGPAGQTVVLMSNIGGSATVSGINLTFSDTGVVPPTVLATGTYLPTNNTGSVTFPAPAPTGPYGSALSVFNGVNPVGQWRLFVVDSAALDVGTISGGWSLILSTPSGDYTATSGTLTFNPGVTALTVPVTINNDAASEPNQSFFLNLSGAVNATIADAQGVGTIVDNDGGAPPPPPNSYADMAADFGASYGLFLRYNQGGAGTWSQLHPLSPSVMASGYIDVNNNADLVMTFPGYGVWAWMNNASWVQLHVLDATDIALGDLDNNGMDDIVLNFPSYGVWVWYNNASWTQLHVLNSSEIAVANVDGAGGGRDDVMLTFPGYGVWTWANNTTWSQLHVLDATEIETGDLDGNGVAEIILTFPGYGVWARINNATWTQLHPLDSGAGITIANVDNDAAGKMDVVIDFPGFGVWVWYNNTVWIQLHPVNAGLLTTGDVDGNGQSDVIISFPGYGTWIWMNNGGWVQLHPLNPEGIVTGRVDNTFN